MSPGTQIAHYRITAKLGQGGMGAVYRATDTKLDREVAIKVLPDVFARDRERLARFEREAKALAALNHPNIAGIYGLEKSGDSQALVLELVEGEDLSERLKRGPLPVEEALEVCRQIAEALEAAHEKGIIHRDLKPGNIKLLPDGRVKVLDFGLAKVISDTPSTAQGGTALEDSPTVFTQGQATMPGVLLGTAGYMSPEQARGKPVDKRSDIWSFGVVLFECLTGGRLFTGETVTDSVGALLHKEIDWSQLPPETPPTIQLLLRKCLTRDRKRRLRDIGDAVVDLEQAITDPSTSFIRLGEGALQETVRRHGRPVLQYAGIVLACLATLALGWFLRPIPVPQVPPARHTELLIPGPYPLSIREGNNGFALSPDGAKMIYNLDDDGAGLRMRDLASGHDEAIRGASGRGEGHPFFKPDGTRFGGLIDGDLVTIPVSGGTPRKLGDIRQRGDRFRGADWGLDGTIVFAERGQPLHRVSEEGREPQELTQLGEDEVDHAFPQFLPGDTHLLFLVRVMEDSSPVGHLEVVEVATGQRKELGIQDCHFARYCPSGHLLFARGGEIFAVAFDPERLEMRGKPKVVLEGVAINEGWRSQFDVAADGTLVYLTGEDQTSIEKTKTLAWIDANDQPLPFTEKKGEWQGFDLSPDERRVAIEIDGDIWILDKTRKDFETLRPLLRDESDETQLLWSRDGKWIYFTSDREAKNAIWKIKTDYSDEPAELVWESGGGRIRPESVSESDFLYSLSTPGWGSELWRLPLDEPDAQPDRILKKEGVYYAHAELSSDGKWLAYVSGAEGLAPRVYLRSLDGSEGSEQVSGGSGWSPRWSRDGGRIFYRNRTAFFAAALIEQDTRLISEKPREVLRFDQMQRSFEWTVAGEQDRILALVNANEVIPESDGEPDPNEPTDPTRLNVVANWFTELNEKIPPLEQ